MAIISDFSRPIADNTSASYTRKSSMFQRVV